MKNLIIIGAGGAGREVLQWAKDMNKFTPTWNIKGFLDSNPNALENVKCDVGVLGEEDKYEILPDDVFVCAIGDGRIRQKVIEKMEARGAEFVSIIHPTAIISESAELSGAEVICPFVCISDNVKLGKGSFINCHSTIGHDSSLGDYCTISPLCGVMGMCRVGKRVFMGAFSNIVPTSKIGDDAYICAGSTVMANVRDGKKVLGNPAKVVAF